jgi:hypothetical protein
MEIGLACCFAALKGSRAVAHSDEPMPLAASYKLPTGEPPQPLTVAPPRCPEDPWDRQN